MLPRSSHSLTLLAGLLLPLRPCLPGPPCHAQPAAGTQVNVLDFGATADDLLDDTLAIQAALDAACAGPAPREVLFPAGTYLVSRLADPVPGVPLVLLELPCTDLRLRGEGGRRSVLRLQDGQGPFESMLGSPAFGQDVSGLHLVDLCLDGNGAANPVSGDGDVDDLFHEVRHALRVYVGSRILVERCVFRDWRNLNTVTLNGVGVRDVSVVDCVFEGTGAPPGSALDWDHSSIYTDCDGALLRGNVFRSGHGPGTLGVRAALETHGPRQRVLRNTVVEYTTGINATGISVLGSPDQLVAGNCFLGVSDGIRIWSAPVPGGPAGPTVERMDLRGNRILVDGDGWRDTQDAFGLPPTGISLEGSSSGLLEDLTIEGNTIEFLPLVSSRPWDRDAAGIRLATTALPDVGLQRLRVLGNRIEGAPATGLYLVGEIEEALVAGNRVVGAGSAPASVPDGLRSGAIVSGSYRAVSFADNCFLDPAGDLRQVFYLFEDHLGGSEITGTGLVRGGPPVPFVRVDAPLGLPWSVDPPQPGCPRGAPRALPPCLR